MKRIILSLLALVHATGVGAAANCTSSDLTVRTATGTYTGLIEAKYPRTRQFRAIPFAEPPVVSRRWLPPQKLANSSEHHYATRFPPSCPQFVTAVTSIYSLNLTKGNLIYNGNQNDSSGLVGEATSEDCLYLAIWAPTTAVPSNSSGLPVLFFMTGGGFIIGGVDIPWQFPSSWVERSQSHIVVTINYRLDILGFPNARGLAHGEQNVGILDQRAALEWVRDNIAAFGGDPARITVWGQSAGGIAADIQSYAFPEDPIAQAYFMQSGTAQSFTPKVDTTYSNFSYVAEHLGCGPQCGVDDSDGLVELDCMRRVPFAQMINFIGQYGDRGEVPKLRFQGVADEKTMFSNWTARAEAGLIARGPVLMTQASNECSTLVDWPTGNVTEGPWPLEVYEVDVEAVCEFYESVVLRNQLGVTVFRYQYAGMFPNLNYYSWLGAYHASDLPMVFGTYHDVDLIANTTEFEIAVSESMQDHVLAFAEDPYNGPQKLGWNPAVVSDANGGDWLRFGADGKVVQFVNGTSVDGVCNGIGNYTQFP